jgi:hypothetical protein
MAGLALAADDFVSINMADVAQLLRTAMADTAWLPRIILSNGRFCLATTDFACVTIDGSPSTSSSVCKLRRSE